jgi:hypothetical protein
MRRLAVAALTAACHAGPAAHAPAPSAPIVVLISAAAEWRPTVAQLAATPAADTPYGGWFRRALAGRDVVFFHGGYGKVAAAGSAQYAIDRWHPAVLINLGTCGGFAGHRKVGDVVLATETFVYDVVELMGSADEAIEDFHIRGCGPRGSPAGSSPVRSCPAIAISTRRRCRRSTRGSTPPSATGSRRRSRSSRRTTTRR